MIPGNGTNNWHRLARAKLGFIVGWHLVTTTGGGQNDACTRLANTRDAGERQGRRERCYVNDKAVIRTRPNQIFETGTCDLWPPGSIGSKAAGAKGLMRNRTGCCVEERVCVWERVFAGQGVLIMSLEKRRLWLYSPVHTRSVILWFNIKWENNVILPQTI